MLEQKLLKKIMKIKKNKGEKEGNIYIYIYIYIYPYLSLSIYIYINPLASKIYFILASRINLLLLTE